MTPKRSRSRPSSTPGTDQLTEGDGHGGGSTVATFVVDRREGDVVVVTDERGHVTDIAASALPKSARVEGAVLRVPLDEYGAPQWGDAVRDRTEERRRRADLARRQEALRRTDPGGDVEL